MFKIMNTSINGYYPRVAITPFGKMNAVELIPEARNIVTLMTGNESYLAPVPTLAVVTAQINALETAVGEAKDGGKIAIATRNAEQASLLSLLRQLASYVQNNCNEDLVTLLSSGFSAVKAPSPVGVLPAPQNARLQPTGIGGQLLFVCKRLDNSLNLTVQYATSPDGPWTTLPPSSTVRVLIDDLKPGTVYWARACGNGSAGPGAWSNPATCMAV